MAGEHLTLNPSLTSHDSGIHLSVCPVRHLVKASGITAFDTDSVPVVRDTQKSCWTTRTFKPMVRWTTKIFSSKQNRIMAKKSKQSSPLVADYTKNTVPLSPFSRNKTHVYNHARHELLRSRSSIRSRSFHWTKMC